MLCSAVVGYQRFEGPSSVWNGDGKKRA